MVTFTIYWECINDPALYDDPAKHATESQYWLGGFQFLSVLFLVFVPMFRCPISSTYDNIWATWMPYVHASLTAVTFVVIPLIVIVVQLTMIGQFDRNIFKSSLWLYFFTSVAVVFVWAPTQILTIMQQA